MKLLDIAALQSQEVKAPVQQDLLMVSKQPIEAFVMDPDRFKSVKDALGDLEQNKHHSIFSFGGVHARHVLPYVVEQIGPCKLFFTTWAISQKSVQTILKLIDAGLVDFQGCVLSDRTSTECPGAFQMIKANTDKYWTSKIHAKGFIAWNDNWHVSVKMTANFTENQRAETYDIMTAKPLFDVHKAWLNKLTNGGIE
jgi:hypothetical protein